jgi:hypothetical protein
MKKSSPRKRNGRLRRRQEEIKIDAVDVNVESELNLLKAE